MKIGVIGGGNVGTALAKRLVPAGHEVMLSFSRDAAALAQAAAAFGASSGTPEQAARFGDVVALTVPWQAVPIALQQAGSLQGKVLWDCTNALLPDMSGLAIGTTTSAGETVQEFAIGARVVKAIPPFAQLLHSADPTIAGMPAGVFMCGDDEDAKKIVRPLLEALPAAVVDAGPLQNARWVEPAGFLLVRLAYAQGLGARIGLMLTTE
jgi:8-hydroxy-5-deazaflavin:NADPH oxidoreductase